MIIWLFVLEGVGKDKLIDVDNDDVPLALRLRSRHIIKPSDNVEASATL